MDGLLNLVIIILTIYICVLIAARVRQYHDDCVWEDDSYLDREVECPECGYSHAIYRTRKLYRDR